MLPEFGLCVIIGEEERWLSGMMLYVQAAKGCVRAGWRLGGTGLATQKRQQKIMGVFGKGLRLFRECPSQETEDCKWQLK